VTQCECVAQRRENRFPVGDCRALVRLRCGESGDREGSGQPQRERKESKDEYYYYTLDSLELK
jgi:hypothetical protein